MVKTLQLGQTVRPTNRPLVAVSMQVTDETALWDYLYSRDYTKADVLEWRLDTWQEIETLTTDIVQTLIAKSERPVILTWRTTVEGGLRDFDKAGYLRIYEAAIKHGVAAVDIEVSLLDNLAELIAFAHTHRVQIIGSRHDWTFPNDVDQCLQDMLKYPVDIIKYVALANNQEQAHAVLHALDDMTQRTDQPLIVMAMGDAGSFTRLESFSHGSQLTFAQTGIASAPGQLSVDEVLRYYTV